MTTFEFCRQVLAQVRFRPDHDAILQELEGHIEDRKEALMTWGLSEEEAEAQAIAVMGDPVELGKALDRAHPCVWSYLFWVLKPVTMVICTCTFFYFALLTIVMLFRMMIPIHINLNDPSVVRYARPNLSVTLNGHHVNIEQVYELEDGAIGIQYTSWMFLPHYSSGGAGIALPNPDAQSPNPDGSYLGHHTSNGVFAFERSLCEWSGIHMEGNVFTVVISAGMKSVSREIVWEELP